MTAATYRILDAVADSFNPLITILALVTPILRKPRTLRPIVAYYLSAVAAIGCVYVVRAVDARQQIWSFFGLDFSAHSAFATSLAVSIGGFQRRWATPLVLAVALYFSLELIMRYHGLLDILSSATLAGLAALLLHMASVRLNGRTHEPSGPVA